MNGLLVFVVICGGISVIGMILFGIGCCSLNEDADRAEEERLARK